MDNPMTDNKPLTPAQRKARERERKALAGLKELRGIYLTPHEETIVKNEINVVLNYIRSKRNTDT